MASGKNRRPLRGLNRVALSRLNKLPPLFVEKCRRRALENRTQAIRLLATPPVLWINVAGEPSSNGGLRSPCAGSPFPSVPTPQGDKVPAKKAIRRPDLAEGPLSSSATGRASAQFQLATPDRPLAPRGSSSQISPTGHQTRADYSATRQRRGRYKGRPAGYTATSDPPVPRVVNFRDWSRSSETRPGPSPNRIRCRRASDPPPQPERTP